MNARNIREIFDESPIGLCVIDRRTLTRVQSNRRLLRMLKAESADALHALPWQDTFADPRDFDLLCEKLERGEALEKWEVLRKSLDGGEWWDMIDSTVGTFDGADAIFLWQYDISARKRAELALVDMASHLEQLIAERTAELTGKEQLLRSIVENIPVSLVVKDSDHRVEMANSTYPKWRGIAPDKVIGARTDEIDLGHTPAYAEIILREEREVMASGVNTSRESERVLADGANHVLKITKFPIYDGEGAVSRVGSMAVDITAQVAANRALREQEERFRDFALSASDWFWETDKDHRFTFFSERADEITDIDTGSLLGKTRWEITGEDIQSPQWQRHIEAVTTYRPFRNFQYEVRASDGQRQFISVSGKPVFDAEGSFLGYRGTGSDVSHQRMIEEARDEALRAAERANQAKSEFLATMSHELRTPLNAIIGFSDIMHQQYFGPLGGERYEAYVSDIHQSAVHLLDLVDDILDLSAIEKGGKDLTKEQVDLASLFDECSRAIRDRADEKGIAFEQTLAPGLDFLHADRRAVKQVLFNLLSNSLRFTPEGGNISLKAGLVDGAVEIVVADTGSGIEADKLENIKNPFGATNPDPYKAGKGWGLGLAIANSLVALHDGEMRIDSVVGKGTTVTVSLPVDG
jgi:two-component system cell cycle sensor histidine kinase PleC